MKNKLILLIIIFISIIFVKYYISNYYIKYNLNNHNIEIKYFDKRFYIEIDNKYNMDLYVNRKSNMKLIKNIKDIVNEDFTCVYPEIPDVKTYPLCVKDGIQIDYNLIDNEQLNVYKSTQDYIKSNDKFVYYKLLNDNEYVSLWNYKGYVVMNNNTYKIYNLFENDRYDNSLSYMLDNYIFMPNYDQEHEFTQLIKFDVETGKKEVIDLKYTIDYDSYIVGSINKNIYLFDNKHSILYEINTKKNKTIIKASNNIGYVKYNKKEFVTCSKSEYKVNRISFDVDNSIYKYEYNNGLYKSIKDNKKI